MVYITGDKHSHMQDFQNAINQVPEANENDTMIVLGDVGFEYGGIHFFHGRKSQLKRFPGTWLIMRGNHDDRYWKEHTKVSSDGSIITPDNGWGFDDTYEEFTLFQEKYPNIQYVYDSGGLYTIENHLCLFCPGAYSVDKEYRIRSNAPYNPDEQLTYSEWSSLTNKVEKYRNEIEYIFSHTYPIEIEDKVKYCFMDGVNENNVDKTSERWLQEIYDIVKDGAQFKHWFFGHLHDDKEIDSDFTMLFNSVVRMEDYE